MKAGLMVVAVVGGVLAGVSGTVSAADLRYDGNELLLNCQQYVRGMDGDKDFNGVGAGMCGGFVQGVDSTNTFLFNDLNSDARFCKPATVTNGQLVRIVVKHLKDNPKLLNKERTGLVWLALKDAYPCK